MGVCPKILRWKREKGKSPLLRDHESRVSGDLEEVAVSRNRRPCGSEIGRRRRERDGGVKQDFICKLAGR